MKKFLLGIFVGLLFAFVCVVVLIGVATRLGANKAPSIQSNSALVLNLEGDLPEVPPVQLNIPFLSGKNAPTVRDVWTSLHAAADDSRIKALVLEPRDLSLGWGKLEELRQDILAFKKSGKPVYAYLRTPGMHEYFIASVADKIYVDPDDYLELKGFRLEAVYLKNLLGKVGVSVDVDHIGKYKDAGDIFTRNNMSPETQEVLNGVLDQVYNNFCIVVGQGRNKSAADMKALIDQGPFLAKTAKSDGLVDELGYENQVFDALKDKLKSGDLAKTYYKSYTQATPGSGTRIALLAGEGDIIRGSADRPFGQASVIASETFSRTINQVRQDKSVKGVIVRIDSPGGDAVASDEILHELKRLAKEKPLVISMSDLAASGGYFISMTGNPIVAYPDTITGSIGVLYGKPVLKGLYDKLGITKDLLTRGKFANIDSDYTPLSDAEKQKLHDGLVSTYTSFVSKVATARRKSYNDIDQIAQGRVWMGEAAAHNGLVDDLGGLDKAVELIRQRAKLPPKAGVDLVSFPPKRSLLDMLFSSNPESLADMQAGQALRSITEELPSPAVMRGGMLEIMPYRIRLK
jgi:protease-4